MLYKLFVNFINMKGYQEGWKIGKYKAFEIEIFWGENHWNSSWFTLKLESREKCDHPGFFFELSLLRLFSFSFSFYDGRHWNWDQNRLFNEMEEWPHYLNDTITEDGLIDEGWEYVEKCPFTGYPIWQKDRHPNDLGSYGSTFVYDPKKSEVVYSTGEFSTVRKEVENMNDLCDFYRILSSKKK